jgi:hypothetical protein
MGLLDKLIVAKPLKNFPAIYETRRFITVFTHRLRHSEPHESNPHHRITNALNLCFTFYLTFFHYRIQKLLSVNPRLKTKDTAIRIFGERKMLCVLTL